MTEPPPRKRFQIHLSTAIVMVFVAGALIWANTITRKISIEIRPGQMELFEHGLPMRIATTLDGRIVFSWDWSNFFINLAVALVILFATWYLSEWLIRRAARKGG